MKQEIVHKSIADLIPYANNARTHSDEQIAQIAASIKEFGFTNPILLDGTNGIIAGHGRLMAARKLSLDTVPCIQLSHLTEAQKKALIIADNQISLNSSWDINTLRVEIERLVELDFDIEIIGFDDLFTNLLDPKEIELGLTPEEKLENYLDGDTKILRLAYNQEELTIMVEMLDKGLTSTGATDYSSLIFGVIREESAKW